MKVGLDISQIAHGGGVSCYTQNLAAELSKLPDLETVFFYSSLRKPYGGNLPHVKSFPIPPTALEILFNKVRVVPIERFIGKVDIFHSSDWMQPKTQAKKVTTYHDVVPLKCPEWSNPKIVEVHKRRLELVDKEIDMVIAVSEATKKDLIEVSNIPGSKITVIHEGVGEQFKRLSGQQITEFKKKYKLPDKFVLAIGGIGERKNLKRIKEASKNYPLVVTGETIPRVTDEEMPLLYNSAGVLFYASLYEGFGLPILEAMACGCPVLTSDVSSMPEVAGDSALLVDPYDVDEMTVELRVLMEDEHIRKDMIGNGILRASGFTWERAAADTIEVYKEVLRK